MRLKYEEKMDSYFELIHIVYRGRFVMVRYIRETPLPKYWIPDLKEQKTHFDELQMRNGVNQSQEAQTTWKGKISTVGLKPWENMQ